MDAQRCDVQPTGSPGQGKTAASQRRVHRRWSSPSAPGRRRNKLKSTRRALGESNRSRPGLAAGVTRHRDRMESRGTGRGAARWRKCWEALARMRAVATGGAIWAPAVASEGGGFGSVLKKLIRNPALTKISERRAAPLLLVEHCAVGGRRRAWAACPGAGETFLLVARLAVTLGECPSCEAREPVPGVGVGVGVTTGQEGHCTVGHLHVGIRGFWYVRCLRVFLDRLLCCSGASDVLKWAYPLPLL